MSHSEGRVPRATAAGITLVFDPKMMWPLMALRGVLAILFGIAALVWPGITALVLALLFAAWVGGRCQVVNAPPASTRNLLRTSVGLSQPSV